MRRFAALAALALAACQPPDPAEAIAAPPPGVLVEAPKPRVSDFSQDMTARGTEPFWALQVRGTEFVLERLGHPDVAATAPGALIQPGKATWSAETGSGRTMRVTFWVSECSDGMSDLDYPMIAEVDLDSVTLRGCAFKTSQPPQPPPA